MESDGCSAWRPFLTKKGFIFISDGMCSQETTVNVRESPRTKHETTLFGSLASSEKGGKRCLSMYWAQLQLYNYSRRASFIRAARDKGNVCVYVCLTVQDFTPKQGYSSFEVELNRSSKAVIWQHCKASQANESFFTFAKAHVHF